MGHKLYLSESNLDLNFIKLHCLKANAQSILHISECAHRYWLAGKLICAETSRTMNDPRITAVFLPKTMR